MSVAAIRLECFGPSTHHPYKRELTEKSLQDAYQQGLADGLERANAEAKYSASQEFLRISEQLRLTEAQNRREFDDLLGQVLVPMLDIVLEHVAPLGMKQRMSQFLVSELLRIEGAGTAATATVRCPSYLLDELDELANTAGVTNIHLEQSPIDTSRVEIAVDQGTVTFDPDQFVSDLRQLIKDIS